MKELIKASIKEAKQISHKLLSESNGELIAAVSSEEFCFEQNKYTLFIVAFLGKSRWFDLFIIKDGKAIHTESLINY